MHVATVRRIITLYDQHGDVAPIKYKHGPKNMLGHQEEDTIIELLMTIAQPYIYLDELQQEIYRSTGTWSSIGTIFRTIHCLGFTRKKLRHVAMQRSDVKSLEFIEEMSYISANMIAWLDEINKQGYHRGLTPTDFKLTVRGKRLSSIGIMSARGVEYVDTYEGSINGDKFCDFVDRCLVLIL